MKTFVLTCSLFAALALPVFAQARDVTFTTELQNYGGDGAYLALYLTDAAGEIRVPFGFPGRNLNTTNTWEAGPGAVGLILQSMTA